MNLFDFFTPKTGTFYLDSNSTLRQALEKFDYHKFTVICLVDESGKFISTISEGDILRYIKNVLNFDLNAAENTRLCEIEIYRPYKVLNVQASFEDACLLALDQNFIPLIDDRGMYIGIVKRKTIINYLIGKKL